MLSQPSLYDGARPNPETERRAPEMGQSRQARLGCKRKSSGSIMAPIAADSQVCCSLWSVLLLVSTFWPKPDVPCAKQQAPLYNVPGDVISFLASSRRPEVTSGSSLGLYINPGAGACRRREEGRRSVLIRQSGSLPRPRRTGAAGHTAALATGWPFQRPAAAGL